MSTKINSGVADLMQRNHEAEQARASRLAFAERIAQVPDSLFAEHPEVARLRERAESLERRYRLTEVPDQRRRIAESIARMQNEIVEAESQIGNTAIDDLADEYLTFDRSFAIAEKVRKLQHGIKSAEKALEVLNLRFSGQSAQLDQLNAARNDFGIFVKELKVAHLEAEDRATVVDLAPGKAA